MFHSVSSCGSIDGGPFYHDSKHTSYISSSSDSIPVSSTVKLQYCISMANSSVIVVCVATVHSGHIRIGTTDKVCWMLDAEWALKTSGWA